MEDVAIIGAGQSVFTRKCGMTIKELCFEGFKDAMQGVDLPVSEIEASIVCSGPEYDKQRTPAAAIAEYLGLNPQPTFFAESACSSSSVGLRVAWSMIKSGLHKSVAVIGFQKMSELTSEEAAERMGRASDVVFESPFGISMPSGYAMFAQAHMARYGTRQEHLARIRVKNSSYGVLNPRAVYRKALTFEEIMASKMVCSPLKVYDCCANADGASCIILARGDIARSVTAKPVWVMGLGAATDAMTVGGKESLTSLSCARKAARQAYQMAGIGPQDIDVAEVHDCFTIAELLAYEDLGFAKPGEGVELIEKKETYIGGKIPVNVDGGLLSKGHPIGATGGAQVRTIVKELRGEAGDMQVNDAEIGLVHNIGGTGYYANITILRR